MPLVTVNIPIYNAERFLRECLESVKAQTFEDFEVIAVLDGCTDRSEEILMDLKDSRFVVVKNERNQGVISGLNIGIDRARGQLLARMDSDDIMLPNRLERQVEHMQANPATSLLGTWFDYLDERGRLIGKMDRFPTDPSGIREFFRSCNCMGGPTMMFRTEQLRALGGYIADYPMAEDLTISLRYLAEGLELANIPEVLVHYRYYPEQNSRKRRAYSDELTNRSYRQYGPQIWGDRAPTTEFGASIPRRIVRKVMRMLGLSSL